MLMKIFQSKPNISNACIHHGSLSEVKMLKSQRCKALKETLACEASIILRL